MPGSVGYIPLAQPFLQTLAQSIMSHWGQTPEGLAQVTILLPTRRSVRLLQDVLIALRQGRPLLMPTIRAVADVDDQDLELLAGVSAVTIPPATSDLERLWSLTRLVRARDPALSYAQAALQARALAQFLDQLYDEDLSLDGLDHLVAADFAAHWQHTVDFLSLLRTAWPLVLAERGVIDRADRRSRLIRALAQFWIDQPPNHPVIMAGISGSLPAVRTLMQTVSQCPQGYIVLTGYDPGLPLPWLENMDDQHPQGELTRTLHALEIPYQGLKPWALLPVQPSGQDSRLAWWRSVMRPSAQSDSWAASDSEAPTTPPKNLAVLEVDDDQDEATAIIHATLVALTNPTAFVQIITPNRQLAQTICTTAQAMGLELNDSGGIPLATTPLAQAMGLVLAMIAHFHPLDVLDLMRHPIFSGTAPPNAAINRFDRAWRGPSLAGGRAGLAQALAHQTDADALGPVLDQWLAPLADLIEAATIPRPLSQWLEIHIRATEQLAGPTGTDLWQGDTAQTLATMLHQALAASDPNHNVSLENYRDIWLDLVGQAVVYPRATGHPRVAVLGVFEARLAHASHVILASFNEGDWPRDPGLDPWLSRAMRRNFGLPARERGTGRLAADLMQWVQAPHVLITRSRRTQGTITPASRWLDRLDVVYGAHHGGAFFPRYTPARPAPPKPIITPNLGKRPGPCPPVALRPFTYSASNIQDLMTNPYQFYARKILRLRPLDPFDQPFDARLMGTLIHSVLDTLIKHGLDPTDPKWNTHATQILDQTLAQTLPNPASRWSVRPRIKMALENFRVQDIQWRAQTGALPIATETTWEAPLTLATGQTITLQARLDRLDAAATGEWMIIDYKTGANLPPKKDCRSGLAPQLPIQEWVVNRGTPVDGIQRSGIMSSAHFWPISPRTGEMVSFAAQAQTSVFPDTDHGLLSLLTVFLDPTTPYWPYPDPARPTKGDDYHHLMRFDEWWGIDDHGGTP